MLHITDGGGHSSPKISSKQATDVVTATEDTACPAGPPARRGSASARRGSPSTKPSFHRGHQQHHVSPPRPYWCSHTPVPPPPSPMFPPATLPYYMQDPSHLIADQEL